MHPTRSKTVPVTFTAVVLLFGSQSLNAECVSATLADEVYYSCSGVLTVVPKETEQAVGSTLDEEAQKSGTEWENRESTPRGNAERPATRLP